MLNCLIFLFVMVTWLQCPIKALNVAYDNSSVSSIVNAHLLQKFSSTTLNSYIAKIMMCDFKTCTVDIKWIVIS